MDIGILCESHEDFKVFAILIQRCLGEAGIQTQEFVSYPANGPIIGKMEAASVRFFKKILQDTPIVHFAVFFSDLDGLENKKGLIQDWITEHVANNPERIIIPAFAEPHFEAWFINEIDCFKAALPDVPSPLPFEELKPKARLRKIIQTYSDLTMESREVFQRLAEVIDLNSLRIRDENFNRFRNDLLTAARRATS